MITKLIEIRDRHTFIPALAIRLGSKTEAERYLLSRAGYGKQSIDQQKYILLAKLDGGDCAMCYDPFAWYGNNTMREAHMWLMKNFDKVAAGDVVDVQFIREETEGPKIAERLELSLMS